ncbi:MULTISPECIES: AMP-binding protein [unclassified Corynebacterium]|uniref:phenylacetate--CoA ligase family protein n=1 Tax=unclassified Corynebacterium TaxID=2624378 RepID=UPI0029CA73D4|nr:MULTISPECIES: AMP-binding protein [unclassified Corynebacterium]WPF66856.1 phenylacetate--CoA ligase family protein [Corynebacterium sp. 22KM0430]WPF69344.1 phenylacetate--CoA ligase family protein [Corynebacterium sp. 21KM1197]
MSIAPVAEHIEFVRTHSPYYRRLYRDLPPRPEVRDLPVVDTAEFWQANHPEHNSVLTAPPSDALVLRSGGTTGAPKFSWWSTQEWRGFCRAFGQGLVGTGMKPGARVANLFYAGDLYASFTFVLDSLAYCPLATTRFPFGGGLPTEQLAQALAEFRITTIAALPSTVITLAEHLASTGRTLPEVELILVGGELLFDDRLPLLRAAFPHTRVGSVGYASVDAGLLGRPVPGGDLRVHQSWHPYTHTEILDEETNAPITEPGIPGRLVVTDLRRRLMPIVRYPAGDRAQWVDYAAGTFRLMGRTGDALRIAYVTMYTEDVHAVVSRVDAEKQITALQLVAVHKEGLDGLILRAATVNPDPHRHAALAREIIAAVLQARPAYAEATAHRQVLPLAVEWVHHRDLATHPRSGKLLRVIDQRPLA